MKSGGGANVTDDDESCCFCSSLVEVRGVSEELVVALMESVFFGILRKESGLRSGVVGGERLRAVAMVLSLICSCVLVVCELGYLTTLNSCMCLYVWERVYYWWENLPKIKEPRGILYVVRCECPIFSTLACKKNKKI